MKKPLHTIVAAFVAIAMVTACSKGGDNSPKSDPVQDQLNAFNSKEHPALVGSWKSVSYTKTDGTVVKADEKTGLLDFQFNGTVYQMTNTLNVEGSKMTYRGVMTVKNPTPDGPAEQVSEGHGVYRVETSADDGSLSLVAATTKPFRPNEISIDTAQILQLTTDTLEITSKDPIKSIVYKRVGNKPGVVKTEVIEE